VAEYSQANQWGRQSGPTPEQAAAHAKVLAEKVAHPQADTPAAEDTAADADEM
jgi:hypothetical protein